MKDFKLTDIEGIGPTKSKALINVGITSPIDIIVRGSKEFSRVASITTEAADKIVRKIREQLKEDKVIVEISDMETLRVFRENREKIPVGCESLDDMTRGLKDDGTFEEIGGFETQAIYEIYGTYGCGKTQIALTTMVEALAKGKGVMFIDCEGTFELGRLNQIANARGLDIEEGLKNTVYKLVTDSSELIDVVNESVNLIGKKNIQVYIIDGMIGLFRNSYEGRGELAERQGEIKRMLKHLKNMSIILNMVIILTNQVQANPDPWGEKEKPIGGYIFGHAVKYIVAIKKGLKNNRIARLKKSPSKAEADYPFYITEAGVSDEELFKKKVDINKTTEWGLMKKDLLLEIDKKV